MRQLALLSDLRWLSAATCHRLAALVLLLITLTASVAHAHKPSDSYLKLHSVDGAWTVEWDIALRDLDHAVGLDSNGDGAITWGELRTRHAAIADYTLARLTVRAGEAVCTPTAPTQAVDQHSDGMYTVLRFRLDCPLSTAVPHLHYRLFFDLDPTHRGLVQLQTDGQVQTTVLSPDRPRLELHAAARSGWQQFGDYWQEGVWHIWHGFDHILFLLALLLPAVLWREAGGWRQADSFRNALWNVTGIVTAFTIAHSLTLSIAALGWVELPSRWVETAIAATVILAAFNNLYPLIQGRRWLLAFGLGLIHGFGFASVLRDLGLPGDALALALVGFNLGVESGQLVIIAAFLPIAFLLRGSWYYQRLALQGGSLAVAAVALLWLLERGLDRTLMPL